MIYLLIVISSNEFVVKKILTLEYMKQILTFLDIRTLVNELQENKEETKDGSELAENISEMEIENKNKKSKKVRSVYKQPFIGTYVQNIYSTSQRSFYFKTNKSVLFIEISGRLHLTSSVPPGNHELTFFCTKLRSYLRRKKIRDVIQIDFDRQVAIDFGEYIMVVQIFAAGNLFILEKNTIEETSDENTETKTQKKFRQKVEKVVGKKVQVQSKKDYSLSEQPIDLTKKYKIIDIFRPVPEYNMIKGEYFRFNPVCLKAEYQGFQSISNFLGLEKEFHEAVEKELKQRIATFRAQGKFEEVDLTKLNGDEILIFESFFKNLFELFETNKNYGKITERKGKVLTFFAFDFDVLKTIPCFSQEMPHPVPQKQDSQNLYHTYNSFNEAVDTFYFPKIEKKEIASKKDKIRISQLNYIDDLREEEQDLITTAELVQSDQDLPYIFEILNFVVVNKIDWNFFHEQKKLQSDVFIKRVVDVNFKNCTVIVSYKIDEESKVQISEKKVQKPKKKKISKSDKPGEKNVELFFNESVHKNINRFYTQMKGKKTKREKIENNLETILSKIRERKTAKKAHIITKTKRTQFWFEKYNFTFTRNGLLVIGGKNASQNEQLAKREYTHFFHADVHGGSVCTINGDKINLQNNNQFSGNIQRVMTRIDNELSDQDLEDASQFAMINSNSWKDKIISDTLYTTHNNVTKTPVTGEYINKGGFVLKDKRGYIHNVRMEYSVGLLFCIEKEYSNNKEEIQMNKNRNEESSFENLIFTPSPKDTDEIKFVFPFMGSSDLLKDFKFTQKFVPGKNKKGKLMKDLINDFLKIGNENERKAIKDVGNDEWLNVILSESRASK